MLKFIIWAILFALFIGAIIGTLVLLRKAVKILKQGMSVGSVGLLVIGLGVYILWLVLILSGWKWQVLFIPVAAFIDLLVIVPQFVPALAIYLQLRDFGKR